MPYFASSSVTHAGISEHRDATVIMPLSVIPPRRCNVARCSNAHVSNEIASGPVTAYPASSMRSDMSQMHASHSPSPCFAGSHISPSVGSSRTVEMSMSHVAAPDPSDPKGPNWPRAGLGQNKRNARSVHVVGRRASRTGGEAREARRGARRARAKTIVTR
jgi:hypothetical protein